MGTANASDHYYTIGDLLALSGAENYDVGHFPGGTDSGPIR